MGDEREKELLKAIGAAVPGDDTPRLVYADWLLEQGDPWGEFIHLQCMLANASNAAVKSDEQLVGRELELRRAHQESWIGVPFDERVTWQFDRGFPTGRVAHAGIFMSPTPTNSPWCRDGGGGTGVCIFRCFPDGVVVMRGQNSGCTEEHLPQIARWFTHGYSTRGTYEITFARNTAPSIHFELLEQAGDQSISGACLGGRVACTGTMSNHEVTLDWRSQIHFNDEADTTSWRRGAVSLSRFEVAGCDSRA